MRKRQGRAAAHDVVERTRQGSGEVAMTCSADALMHTIQSASATEHTGKRSGHHCTVIQRYNCVPVVVFFGYTHTAVRREPQKRASQRVSPAACAPQPLPHGLATSRRRTAASPSAGSRLAAPPNHWSEQPDLSAYGRVTIRSHGSLRDAQMTRASTVRGARLQGEGWPLTHVPKLKSMGTIS